MSTGRLHQLLSESCIAWIGEKLAFAMNRDRNSSTSDTTPLSLLKAEISCTMTLLTHAGISTDDTQVGASVCFVAGASAGT